MRQKGLEIFLKILNPGELKLATFKYTEQKNHQKGKYKRTSKN